MTNIPPESTVQDLAGAEPSCGLYSGVTREMVRDAVEFGRVPIDLFTIPKDQRQDVYDEIIALIRRRTAELGTGPRATVEPAAASGCHASRET